MILSLSVPTYLGKAGSFTRWDDKFRPRRAASRYFLPTAFNFVTTVIFCTKLLSTKA